MRAHELLATQEIKRTDARYIFRRRGLMTTDNATMHISTLDVSLQGFGVMGAEPVRIGKPCSIALHTVIGERVIQLSFSCKAVYCILTGIDGFRIGLHIDDQVESHRQQLHKIIATCSSLPLLK